MDKKKAITAAAAMEPGVSRRRLLVGIATASASAAIAAPDVADAAVIQDPLERARFHADQLAAAMEEINPAMRWKVKISAEDNFAMVVGHEKKEPAPIYDGPNFYEVELSNGTRPVLWLERHEYQTVPGHYYTGAHRWGNKFETKPRRFSEKQLTFIRKIENFGRA